MSELCLNSTLSMEEIDNNFKNVDFFAGIMDSLQEILDYAQGKETKVIVRERSLPD